MLYLNRSLEFLLFSHYFMSLYIEFLSVIIPMEKIKACTSVGGLMGILELEKEHIGKRIYFDEDLYRDGAMGPIDIENIVKFWESHGLVGIENRNGTDYLEGSLRRRCIRWADTAVRLVGIRNVHVAGWGRDSFDGEPERETKREDHRPESHSR